jgi:hypothetical protein
MKPRFSLLTLAFFLSLAVGCAEPAQYDPNDPLTGTWIGKWDDAWAVMFIVKRCGDRYDVIYKWEEHIGQPFGRAAHQRLEKSGTTLSLGYIVLEFDESQSDRATAKGNFKTPRSARLVRIAEMDENVLTVSYVKQQLALHE